MDSNRPLKKAKLAKSSNLPTKDEQKDLLQMESLLRSNLLSLQTTELLQQVDGEKVLSKKKLSQWLEKLNSDILSASLKIKNKDSSNELSTKWLAKQNYSGINIMNDSIKFVFLKPTSSDFIGSYAIQTSTAPLLNVDITITLPHEIFDEKDILNHKYFDKRNLYLAGLAASLSKIKKDDDGDSPKYEISFSWFKGDRRKVILEIDSPFIHANSKIVIRIIPALPENVFRLVQLRPQKNNVRPADWALRIKSNKEKGVKDSALNPSSLPPTPLYNMAILEDIVILSHHEIISKMILPNNFMKDAVVLFKVWLTQRFFRYPSDGFDSHDICMLLSYLIQTRRISTTATALATFQYLLTFLAEHDLTKVVCNFTSIEMSKRDSDSFNGTGVGQLIHPIAVNADGIATDYNVLWRVSKSTLNALRGEAKKSLKELQYNQESCFDHLFMQKMSFFEKHDLFFHFEIDTNLLNNFENTSEEIVIDNDCFGGDEDIRLITTDELQKSRLDFNCHQYFSQKAVEIVSKALGDRAVVVNSFIRSSQLKKSENNKFYVENSTFTSNFPRWSILEKEENSNSWIISLGIIVDKEKGHRRVERGPSPDDESEQLEEFRYFWGKDKCQLRRFKDGSIIEAVVWDSTSDNSSVKKSDKELIRPDVIIDNIIRHVLGRHLMIACGENGSNVVSCLTSQLESFYYSLTTGGNKRKNKNSVDVNLEDSDSLCRIAIESLDQLRTILTSKLKNIPLSFESLMAISPELRYSSVLPPRQQPILIDKDTLNIFSGKSISLLTNPLRVFVKLESSGKWPIEGEAILKSKTALLLKTRSELMKQFQIHSVIHRDCLDIFYNGYIFRVLLQASNDVEYLVLKSDPSLQVLKREDVIKNIIRINAIPPLHHLAIKSLHSMFPSYSASVKLLAVWIANHYFTGHLCHEVIELLVASVYLNPSSAHPPSSALSGFYQALLCLGNHDWDSDPFIVDLSGNNSDISSITKVGIVEHFRSIRSQKRSDDLNQAGSFNVPMYIVSSSDKLIDFMPSLASKSPERAVLSSIVSSAQSTSKKLLSWISSCVEDNVNDLKTTQLSEIMSCDRVLENCNVIFKFHKGVLNSNFTKGPPVASLPVYANLSAAEYAVNSLVVRESESSSNPLQEEFIEKIRDEFKNEAVFFWNGLTGSELGLIWRPKVFIPKKLSILSSRNRFVISDRENSNKDKNADSMTLPNIIEVIAQIVEISDGLVVDVIVK